MTITLHFWWSIPAALTAVFFGAALWSSRNDVEYISGFYTIIVMLAAAAASLFAWFIGALFK